MKVTKPLKQKQKAARSHAEETKYLPLEGIEIIDVAELGVSIMAVYLATLYPSIAGGDSGELVAESCHLGVSHPPGYPLFNMLIHLFTRLPIPSVSNAWKANCFSAVCDTLCAIFMYMTIMLWTKRYGLAHRWSAITAAALFAFSPLIWTYAIGAEVFSLNNFFVSLLLLQLFRYAESGAWKDACIGALLSGLALCNQHTVILLEIPIVLWVLWTQRKLLTLPKMFQLALLFFLGLTPYIYMPIASAYNPQPGSWGHVTTWSGFFHHLRRGDYGSFRLYSSNEASQGLWERLFLYSIDLVTREGMYIAAPLAIIGMLASLFSKEASSKHVDESMAPSNLSSISYLVGFAYLFYLFVFHALANLPLNEGLLYGVHMRFWQQPNVIVFIWMGVGLAKLFSLPSLRKVDFVQHVVCPALVLLQVWRWLKLCDQHEGWYIHNYAKALIDPLPKGALYFTNYDLQWTSLRYLQRCEGFRSDVVLINLSMMTYKWFQHKHQHYPTLKFPGTHLVPAGSKDGGFSMKQLLDANYDQYRKKGVFLGGKLSYDDPDIKEAYATFPLGLLSRFVKSSKVPELDKWYWKNHQVMEKVHSHLKTLPPSDPYDDETWEWTIKRDYYMHQVDQATFLLEKVVAKNSSIPLLVEAAKALEFSLVHEPKEFVPDHLLKNLGLAYANMVKTPEAFPDYPEGQEPFAPYVGQKVPDPKNYKERASSRMVAVWRKWIRTKSAKHDPGYEAIKGIVKKFGSKYP